MSFDQPEYTRRRPLEYDEHYERAVDEVRRLNALRMGEARRQHEIEPHHLDERLYTKESDK